MAERQPDPLLGAVLQGKYRIDGYIASGAMGAVYRATQLAVNRPVAIKVLRILQGLDEDEQRVLERRFEREAHTTSQLQHPHSIRLFDYGETPDGRPYLAMELLRGKTLRALLRAERRLPPWRVAKIARQICKSLQEAHGMGVVHRDLKPGNVFLTDFEGESDFVKVVDFGVARMSATDTDQASLTRTGHAVGTPRYMAPEQALGQPLSGATDLYAVGVMMFEMLSGAPPFIAESAVATAMMHANTPAPDLPSLGLPQEVEKAWAALVLRLLSKTPEARPSNAATVAAALEHLELKSREVAGLTSSTESGISSILRSPDDSSSFAPTMLIGAPERALARRRSTWAATGAALLLGAIVGAVCVLVFDGSTGGGALSETTATSADSVSDPVAESEAKADASTQSESASHETTEPDTLVVAAGSPAERSTPDAADPQPPPLPDAADPQPPPLPDARIVIRSKPPGASVTLGASRVCTTPCEIGVPAAGEREALAVALEGHEPRTFEADLGPGAHFVMDVVLEPKRDAAASISSKYKPKSREGRRAQGAEKGSGVSDEAEARPSLPTIRPTASPKSLPSIRPTGSP